MVDEGNFENQPDIKDGHRGKERSWKLMETRRNCDPSEQNEEVKGFATPQNRKGSITAVTTAEKIQILQYSLMIMFL